jgi:hypothetical protein
MKKYFDLNNRTHNPWNQNLNSLIVKGQPDIFPESGEHLSWKSPAVRNEGRVFLSVTRQLLMYLGTFIGVLLSTAVTHFRTGNIDLTITVGEVLVSAVIALVIIPLVYEKLNLNPKAPFIVQFGLFVQNGVFWHVLIDSIGSVL